MLQQNIVLNGVNGATGSYLTPALSVEQVARLARGDSSNADHMNELKALRHTQEPKYGVPWGVDSQDLAQSGWCVLFPHDAPEDLRRALAPLLEHRAAQAAGLYKEFEGPTGHRPGETARTWLTRQGAGPGQAQLHQVPYYLLIVADPERISFRFQYEIGVNYAVGRIHFDTVEEYGRYAKSVVEHESVVTVTMPKSACIFGVRNKSDYATQLSADHLSAPLATALEAKKTQGGWKVQRLLADDASKKNLVALLNGSTPPALLFTASHGMGFPKNHALQSRHQGALLCQDWPGPLTHTGPIPPEFYFSADDISDDARLVGTVAFHFACFGGGTPKLDEYAHRSDIRDEIATRAFLARLPQRMLSAPNGGALAVVGHVERAWGYSFMWPGIGDQTSTFENCLSAMIEGARVGVAMESFAMKHADLAVSLNGELEDIKFGATPDPMSLANLWTANNDARSYIILGDPAVRLPH